MAVYSMSAKVSRNASLFSVPRMPLRRIGTVYKYIAVMALLLASTGIVVLLCGKRNITLDDLTAERSASSRRSVGKTTRQTDLHIEGPVVNPHPFRYLLNPETFCHKKDIFIITYVHSAPDHFEKRDAIRQTWGKMKYYLNKRVEVVFIMGQVANAGVMTSVRNESVIHGDVVQEDFVDSYHNLTYKAIAGLKWVSTFCRQAVYVLKTNDDIFVNFYVFMRYIQSTVKVRYGRTGLILCNVWLNDAVERNKLSELYLSKKDFPQNFFPPFCSGTAFLMSRDITDGLYMMSYRTPFFWMDEQYITGVLIEKLNITHKPYNIAYSLHPSDFRKHVTSHKYYNYAFFLVDKRDTMYYLWNTVVAREIKAVHTNITNVNQNINVKLRI
ncbi:beta-1,3-galactosyltransferase 5-like isoform X2 [Gigantopelta aegis]|nr:beta-1,3-galactosyltransferase 5-like isoform X2 [Gigantopelta aegis]